MLFGWTRLLGGFDEVLDNPARVAGRENDLPPDVALGLKLDQVALTLGALVAEPEVGVGLLQLGHSVLLAGVLEPARLSRRVARPNGYSLLQVYICLQSQHQESSEAVGSLPGDKL